MNATLDRLMGKFKVKAGHATGDTKLTGHGHIDQAKAHVADAATEAKAGVDDITRPS